MKDIKNKKNGFGIIEVLVATVLLMIIVGSVIGLGRVALRNNVLATQRTQAFNLVREKIESFINQRNANWEAGVDWDRNISATSVEIKEPTKNIDGTDFIRSWEVKTTTSSAFDSYANESAATKYKIAGDIKFIIVKVSWSYSGQNYDVSDKIILTDWKPQL